MDARQLQSDYEALQPKTLATVGKLLGKAGEPFDRDLNRLILQTRKRLTHLPEFTVCMAEALVWARYAVRDDAFFTAAAAFIENGSPQLLDDACQHPDRFGAERLRDALAAFRRWYDEMTDSLSAVTATPLQLKALQERSLRVAGKLKRIGELRGVGLWLFPAPFKIMAVAHPEIWDDATLEAVVMPTGTQVEHALRMLHRANIVTIDAQILAGGSGTFEDEYTNLWTYQLVQKELAHAGQTTVLHINGALHELGKRAP